MWRSGFPTGANHCIAMKNTGCWEDEDCLNDDLYFICENRCSLQSTSDRLAKSDKSEDVVVKILDEKYYKYYKA